MDYVSMICVLSNAFFICDTLPSMVYPFVASIDIVCVLTNQIKFSTLCLVNLTLSYELSS